MHEVPGRLAPGELNHRRPDLLSSATVLRMRTLAAACLGALIAVVPAFGNHRLAIGAIVALGELLMCGYGLQRLHSGEPPTAAIAMTDLLMALAVAGIYPRSLAVTAMVMCGATALNLFWYGPRVTLAVAGAFGTGMVVIGLAQEPPLWIPTVAAYLIVSACTVASLHSITNVAAGARRRYDALVNGIDAVVWEQDPHGHTVFVSGNVALVVGVGAEEFARRGFYEDRVHPGDIDQLVTARSLNERGRSSETHLRVADDSGCYRHLHERVRVARRLDGSVQSTRGFVVDESARWAAEADLRRHTDFIQGIPVALTVLRLPSGGDPRALEIVSMNPAAESLFGSTPADVRLTSHIQLGDRWLERLAAVADGGHRVERPSVAVPGTDGLFDMRAVPLPDRHVGVSLEDVTCRARMAESFRHQAMHDQLTGLPNRSHFKGRLAEVLARESAGAALLLIDLNRFKEINDALGHEYGDRVLREFATRLISGLRGCDLIARLGGDEVAILVTEHSGEQAALEIAGRVLKLCDARFDVGDAHFQVGASVGVALAPVHTPDPDGLMRHADTAMYVAKARGGGAQLYSPDGDSGASRRVELMSELPDAIRDGSLEVHYQPRVELEDYRTVGLEALVRWRHPRLGLLPPADFIELAEVSGTIWRLTQYVGDRASEEISGLLGDHDLSLSINLSSRTLYDARLLEWVEEVMAQRSFNQGRLCFEITESSLTDDPERALVLLHEIHDCGVQFSIDDFGTGHSSLSYLRELPIEEIKIDRSFVSMLRTDDSIVRSAIDLGHNMGLSVAAEGVEDAVTDHLLRTFGCDSAQGFRWGAPMPAVALAAHLSGAWENPVAVR